MAEEQRAATGGSEGVPADGGFLVQKDFSANLFTRMYETGALSSRVEHVGISGNSNGLKVNGVDETSRANGSRWGGVLGYWANEAATVTKSKPTFRQMNLDLNKLFALYYATEELLADASALGQIVSRAFTEEIGFKLDDAIYRGTGAGQPLGVIVAPAVVQVAKETSQLADTIVTQNIFNMWSRCYGRSRANAVWFINQEIEPQLFAMTLAVGTGGIPVYLPANGLSSSPYGTLMGRPVVPIEQASALGDVGDISLLDLSQYLLIDKGGIKADSSIHVRFIYDESTFRFIYRVDGQPFWNSALTPYKATTGKTLSPFVTLAERT
jgi:HK97 family phage major capsid protein